MHTALDIISLWPSRADLAADLGVDLTTVHSWVKRSRGRIPPEHYAPMVAAAERRGIALSYADLAHHRKSQTNADNSRHFADSNQATRKLRRARAEGAA